MQRQRTDLKIWAVSDDFEETAEKVGQLTSEIAKLLHINAVTQLTLAQVKKTQLANEKAAAKKNRPRQPRRRRTPRVHATAPGSRIGAEFP
jgi:uncharacterized membrane-anchored protein YhcB (DUF1043 family)